MKSHISYQFLNCQAHRGTNGKVDKIARTTKKEEKLELDYILRIPTSYIPRYPLLYLNRLIRGNLKPEKITLLALHLL